MSLLLLILFMFCLTACSSDLKTGKVRNKDLLFYLLLGALYYAILTVKGITSHDQFIMQEVKMSGINFFLAFISSFILRSFGIWPAGDAKTYALVNLLIPISCYKHIYFGYFPGFTLLLNIFIAGILFVMYKSAHSFMQSVFTESILNGLKNLFRNMIKQLSLKWPSYLAGFSSYMIICLSMSLISNIIFTKAGSFFSARPEIFFVLLFFIMKPIGNFLSKYLSKVDHALFYIFTYLLVLFANGWSFDSANVLILGMVVSAIKFMAIYGIIMITANYYISSSQIIVVDVMDLKEGDLPTKMLVDSLSPGVRERFRVPAEGMTSDNLAMAQEDLLKKGDTVKTSVYQPIPFVPIIFAGVIFTVLTGISLAQGLKYLFFM